MSGRRSAKSSQDAADGESVFSFGSARSLRSHVAHSASAKSVTRAEHLSKDIPARTEAQHPLTVSDVIASNSDNGVKNSTEKLQSDDEPRPCIRSRASSLAASLKGSLVSIKKSISASSASLRKDLGESGPLLSPRDPQNVAHNVPSDRPDSSVAAQPVELPATVPVVVGANVDGDTVIDIDRLLDNLESVVKTPFGLDHPRENRALHLRQRRSEERMRGGPLTPMERKNGYKYFDPPGTGSIGPYAKDLSPRLSKSESQLSSMPDANALHTGGRSQAASQVPEQQSGLRSRSLSRIGQSTLNEQSERHQHLEAPDASDFDAQRKLSQDLAQFLSPTSQPPAQSTPARKPYPFRPKQTKTSLNRSRSTSNSKKDEAAKRQKDEKVPVKRDLSLPGQPSADVSGVNMDSDTEDVMWSSAVESTSADPLPGIKDKSPSKQSPYMPKRQFKGGDGYPRVSLPPAQKAERRKAQKRPALPKRSVSDFGMDKVGLDTGATPLRGKSEPPMFTANGSSKDEQSKETKEVKEAEKPEKKGKIRGFFFRAKKGAQPTPDASKPDSTSAHREEEDHSPTDAELAEAELIATEPQKPQKTDVDEEKERPRSPSLSSKKEDQQEQATMDQLSSADEQPADATVDGQVGFDPRLDLSTRLLALCERGEWNMVENLLRNASRSDLNLQMADAHDFTPLMLAVRDGRLSTVERLIELGADIKDTTKDDRNLAHIAAMYARDDVTRYLLTRKVDINIPAGPKGQLPLHMACSRPTGQTLPLVQLLLKSTSSDQDPRLIEDKNGAIPLLLAIEAGNAPVCKELLSVLPDKQTKMKRKDTGENALHLACRRKDGELIKFLLDNGAEVDAQNNEGQTGMHIVTEEGAEGLLRLFYSARANPNIPDKEDRTPIHIAAQHGYVNIVEILADKFKSSITARTKDGSTLMHIASANGHPETALAFLKRGVPLHMPNKNGALGLHCAAACGHTLVIKTLLQRGANVDAITKDHYTALHIATQNGQHAVVETLIGNGANVHIRGGQLGETPLHLAAGLEGVDGERCAEMLIKSGAEVNVRLENGETALHIASRKGNPRMLKLLLAEDADPMATSKVGESALHVACRHCHYSAAQMILEFVEQNRRKEDAVMLVNYQSSEGESSMHYASEITRAMTHYATEDADMIRLLLEYGGEVNVTTTLTQETVLHYCARAGNDTILAEIVKKIGPGAAQISLNKQSKNGWSPLLEACSNGHLAVVQILLKHHARVDVFDEAGRTALHLAAENGHTEICDTLLKHKAFVNSKTKLGVTPLHLAAMHGHYEVVQLMVQQHKATIDAVTLDNRTPLHVAGKHGQQQVCSILLAMGANANAKDLKGQTPLHLAAESDYPEVVKLFLKLRPDLNTLTATDENGFNCAHIAAMKGSVAVIRELMMIDKAMVIEAQTKTTESTALHLAAAGGHKHVVKVLLDSGAHFETENATGLTPLHLAAKFGHINICDIVDKSMWGYHSKKTGLTPLHVAAYFGQIEFVRYLLGEVAATVKSELPGTVNPFITKELATEYGLTPLHMAAISGHEGLVRLLLNFQGVQVDAPSATQAVIPLHLAAQSGHVAVVGLLLSRSTHQLHLKDSKGRTSLHLAANMGHLDMVSLLIGQGSNINAMDQGGWTALHFATKAGHMPVVKLLIEAGADPRAETREGKVSVCFAAAANHVLVLSYLVQQDHDSYQLMEDRKFIFDLMVCGKNHGYKPVEEFILLSPAPIDIAVKLSSLYREMSAKEKERAKDLTIVSEYCEDMAVELLSIASTEYNAALLLKSSDNRGRPFLDVLIENEQKRVVSHAAVQRYLTEIWNGGVTWGTSKFLALFAVMLFCPPIWVVFCLPLETKMCKAPIIKFICHLISHLYLTTLLVVEVLSIWKEIYKVNNILPNWVEWVLLLFLSGALVAELSSPGTRSGLAVIKVIMLAISVLAVLVHVYAFLDQYFVRGESKPDNTTFTALYIRNQLFAVCLLSCFVSFLDFLTVHHLFGPWAIIIRDLMYDLARFLVILALFVVGFTLHVTSIFQPAYDSNDPSETRLANPMETLEMLFFSLFGLVEPDVMPPLHRTPAFSIIILKAVFGVYMMVTLIVLINLLIAMMSDTYQRIQAQSDMEWKFGRAKLIRQMNKKSATAAPVNIFTKFYTVLKVAARNKCNLCTSKAQEDMRLEENIDAFSMNGDTGRTSPVLQMLGKHKDDDEAALLTEPVHGTSHSWQIDTVINWKQVVATFHIYQGGGGLPSEGGEPDTRLDERSEIVQANGAARTLRPNESKVSLAAVNVMNGDTQKGCGSPPMSPSGPRKTPGFSMSYVSTI